MLMNNKQICIFDIIDKVVKFHLTYGRRIILLYMTRTNTSPIVTSDIKVVMMVSTCMG